MSSGKQSCFFFPKVYTICFLFLSCTCWNFSIGGWRGAVRGDVLGSHSARGGVQVFTSKCDGSCRLFEDVLIKLRKFCVPGWTGLLFITGLRQLDFVLPWCYFLHVSCAWDSLSFLVCRFIVFIKFGKTWAILSLISFCSPFLLF